MYPRFFKKNLALTKNKHFAKHLTTLILYNISNLSIRRGISNECY